MTAWVALLGLIAGCAVTAPSDGDRDQALGSACAWIAGRWTFDGCGETQCTYYEDGCQVHYDCTSRSNSIGGTGSIVGNKFTFGGGQCTATIVGRSMSGSCPTCTFTATHR
jgi:hypothetical protein